LPKNNGNLSPRIALSYHPTKLQKLHLRAAYGLFYGTTLTGPSISSQLLGSGAIKIVVLPFPFSLLPYAMPQHRFLQSAQLPNGINFIPQLSQIATTQPNLRSGYSQQVTTGFDYFIKRNTTVSVNYNFVRGIKLLSVRNINPVVRPVRGNPLLSAMEGRVDPTQGDIFDFESAFDSYYNALTIAIERRFTNRFGFLAYYTFSKAIDNFVDFRGNFQEAVNPLRPGDERGLSLQDVRNRFVLSGSWELSYKKNRFLRDIQLSTIITLESGRPFNLLAGVDQDMNGDNPPADRPLGLGRNVGITPGFASADLRLQRSIKVNEYIRFQGIVEVFNLFNRVNIDPNKLDRIFPPDAHGRFNLPPQEGGRFIIERDRYRGAFAPRQLQLGFRLLF
jgi:hypothetical protein